MGETGNERLAYTGAGIKRAEVRKLEAADESFALAVQDAREEYADRVEEEADRRARLGWDEAVYQLGKRVGYVRKYDSNLMRDLLAAVRPSKFRQGVAAGGPTLVFVDRRESGGMTAEAWAERYPSKVTAEIGAGETGGEAGDDDPRGAGGAVPRFPSPDYPRASIPLSSSTLLRPSEPHPPLSLPPLQSRGAVQDPDEISEQASGAEGPEEDDVEAEAAQD